MYTKVSRQITSCILWGFRRGHYWEMRARSKMISVDALYDTQGLHTMEGED